MKRIVEGVVMSQNDFGKQSGAKQNSPMASSQRPGFEAQKNAPYPRATGTSSQVVKPQAYAPVAAAQKPAAKSSTAPKKESSKGGYEEVVLMGFDNLDEVIEYANRAVETCNELVELGGKATEAVQDAQNTFTESMKKAGDEFSEQQSKLYAENTKLFEKSLKCKDASDLIALSHEAFSKNLDAAFGQFQWWNNELSKSYKSMEPAMKKIAETGEKISDKLSKAQK
jgi:hypothetical protein